MQDVIHIAVDLKDTADISRGNTKRTFSKLTFYFKYDTRLKQKIAELQTNPASPNLEKLKIDYHPLTIDPFMEPCLVVDWSAIDFDLFYHNASYSRTQVVASGASIIHYMLNEISFAELKESQLNVQDADDIGGLLAKIPNNEIKITIRNERGPVPGVFSQNYITGLVQRILESGEEYKTGIPTEIPGALKDRITEEFAQQMIALSQQLRTLARSKEGMINAASSRFFKAFEEECASLKVT